MGAEQDPLENVDDSPLYKWTIRGLYAVALAVNIYVLLDMAKDDAELAVLRKRLLQVVERARRPFTAQQEWRKAVARMHWDALQIVEEGAADG
jgi:hypothetical protein